MNEKRGNKGRVLYMCGCFRCKTCGKEVFHIGEWGWTFKKWNFCSYHCMRKLEKEYFKNKNRGGRKNSYGFIKKLNDNFEVIKTYERINDVCEEMYVCEEAIRASLKSNLKRKCKGYYCSWTRS